MTGPVTRMAGLALRGLIALYRYGISPLLPPSCRFHPTCSCYADQAIRRHGPLKGTALALGRVLRCHPFARGGYDTVPDEIRPVKAFDPLRRFRYKPRL